ncbi:MAG TPA: helix-turn-helix domain-containing protein [Devosiaceae bacterium]|jgi:DNA-binding HxlR family transcriptional regulator
MYKKTFEDMNCSIARSLDQIGEWWSLLIVRECTLGTTRFDEFQRRLGIARNVLTNRLAHLIEQGIVEKLPLENSQRYFQYRLTRKGEELYPVLVALLQWGDRWIETEKGPPLRLIDNRTQQPIEPMAIRSTDSGALGFHDIRLEAGPGATADTHAMIEHRNSVILGDGR